MTKDQLLLILKTPFIESDDFVEICRRAAVIIEELPSVEIKSMYEELHSTLGNEVHSLYRKRVPRVISGKSTLRGICESEKILANLHESELFLVHAFGSGISFNIWHTKDMKIVACSYEGSDKGEGSI